MINYSILFLLRYYSYLGALFVLVSIILTVKTEIISMIIQQDISFNQILKKYLAESLDDFLRILKTITNKKNG